MLRPMYLLHEEGSDVKRRVDEDEARRLLASDQAYECPACSGPGVVALHPVPQAGSV